MTSQVSEPEGLATSHLTEGSGQRPRLGLGETAQLVKCSHEDLSSISSTHPKKVEYSGMHLQTQKLEWGRSRDRIPGVFRQLV